LSTASQARAEVVVVDEDARIRVLLEDELHAHGLVSHLCSGIADLIALLQHRSPQLVLLGVRGSDPGLLDELRTLRDCGCEATLVVLSTAEDEGFRRQLRAAGAAEVVSKRQLLEQLPKLLERQIGIAILSDP
jgi:DNA-binding response OmpR family regulator